jgi:phage terminase large subunit
MLKLEIIQGFNRLYKPVFGTKARYIHILGGRGRGGSYFGTDYYVHKMIQPEYFRGYLMRQVAGDVRESLWRDFNDRIKDNETIDEQLFALQDFAMTAQYLPNRNEVITKGFKRSSGNQTSKLKSIAGATHVLVEEAEETIEEDFNQLDDSLRTTKGNIQIMMIFNMPHKDHWIMKRWYNLIPAETLHGKEFEGYYIAVPKEDDSLLSIHSTYRDNIENINETTIQNFLKYRETNFEYYATMVMGLVSEGMKGLIFKKWKPITNNEFNDISFSSFYGLDFGFSSDPVALIEVKAHNENIYIRELMYETGYTNPMIAERFETLGLNGSDEVYADSAEPKSIEELKGMKWNIKPAVKGADSVRAGINFLLSKNVHYVDTGKNLIKEKETYRWAMDANKNPTDKPVDEYNHLIDALRYAVFTKLAKPTVNWAAF